MLRMTPKRIAELRRQEFGPLRGWTRCLCGDEVRLMQKVVLEQVQDAPERRDTRALAVGDKTENARVKRLCAVLKSLGVDNTVLADDVLIGRMNEWLKENCKLSVAKTARNKEDCFACSTNYLVDLEHASIVDVEATAPVRQAEVGSVRNMLMRTEDTFGLHPETLVADTAYGAGEMLGWLVDEQGIDPHIPVFDKTERSDGAFPATAFSFDPEANEYTCPGGKKLKKYWREMRQPRTGVCKDGATRYYASNHDCAACALKPKCTPNVEARRIARHKHEDSRDYARGLAKTDAYLASGYARKKVEMLFAHLKRIMRLDRLRLRGANGAKDEFLLATTVQNLRKLAKLVPMMPKAA